MRIAFLGHSYHGTTRSNDFLLQLLKRLGDVEIFYDESWISGSLPAWLTDLRLQDFDCVVVYQMPALLEHVDLGHPNVIFVPMLDNHYNSDFFWWEERFSQAKILCFSATLHHEIARLAPVRFFAQYSPPVRGLPALGSAERLCGFFWYRQPPIDLALLRAVTGSTVFDRFTVQQAPDPGKSELATLGPAPLALVIEQAEPWLLDRESYLERLAEHTVYFAPRLYEGIGMGFLEAMALGLCVVAPDTPTHNEYISHGTNGLLYDPTRPEPLDFCVFRQLARRGKEAAERRRSLWEGTEADLQEFISTPQQRLARQRTLVDFWRHGSTPRSSDGPVLADSPPTATIVIVRDDDTGHFDATLSSVNSQDYVALEQLVVREPSKDEAGERGARGTKAGEHRPSEAAADYDAMMGSLDKVKSDYVIFLHAGDTFLAPSSVRQLLQDAPTDADVLYGHFIQSDTNGSEELRLVADFAQSCAQLDARGYDTRWMRRIPALPATAIRASRLRQFGFDPHLRFAADYELYRRLQRAGARFFNPDCVIAHCRPEGAGSHVLPLYVEECLRVAIRHGGSSSARRILVGMGVDPVESWEATLWGWVDWARRRNRRRFAAVPAGRVGENHGLASRLERFSRSGVSVAARILSAGARFLQAARFAVGAGTPRDRMDSDETYISEFRTGIDLRRPGRPSFVAQLRGISWREEWGRWTDGPRVEIQFRHGLPRRVRIVLEAFAFEGISPCEVEVTLGAASRRVVIAGAPFQTYSVDLETRNYETILSLSIPLPDPAPGPAIVGQAERRRLGLALRKLTVLEY